MFVPPLAGRSMKHLFNVPLDSQQFICPPSMLLVLGIPGILLGQQRLDLRRQFLGWRELGDTVGLKEMNSGLGAE